MDDLKKDIAQISLGLGLILSAPQITTSSNVCTLLTQIGLAILIYTSICKKSFAMALTAGILLAYNVANQYDIFFKVPLLPNGVLGIWSVAMLLGLAHWYITCAKKK